jgi:hypothetical protein
MAVLLAIRRAHLRHVIRSRYRISVSVTSPEGGVAWRAREGCGPHHGRMGGRSPSASGAGGIGVLPSSPFQRRPYWSGMSPQPQHGDGLSGTVPRLSTGSASFGPTVHRCCQLSPRSKT